MPRVRIITKFTATLLIGISGIFTGSAIHGSNQEMEHFERDMRLDHLVLGAAVADTVRKTWVEAGNLETLAATQTINQEERHLSLQLLDPARVAAESALPPVAQAGLQQGQATTVRDADYQDSFIPIVGPAGQTAVLQIREPLTDEQGFRRRSLLRNAVTALAAFALCSILAVVLGLVWIDRPIQVLCEAARRIGSGDYSGSLKLAGNDELSRLADEMDAMRQAILHGRAKLVEEADQRVLAQQQLRHADRLATVGKLGAGMAHELGTPLNVAWAHANMIARGEVAGAEVVESAKVIAEQSHQMTAIIRQLLDFARPRSVVKVPTDLVALARKTLSFLEPMAQKRSVKLGGLDRRDSLVTEVDPDQVQQVLTNLVVNAIQATGPGGSVEIVVADKVVQPPPDRGGAPGKWHCIEVRDTGVGIAPDDLLQLFEPFFTTKSVGEGTGLGLSVAWGIVRECGGWIEVQSQVGKGSCFAVFLPRRAEE
jgi:signal transduction histidine kinase